MYQYYFDDDLVFDLSKSLVLLVRGIKKVFLKLFYFTNIYD